MNESQRTLIFVVLAAVSLVGARFAGPSTPKPSAEVAGIGEPFYPDFQDAEAAKSLQVMSYNPETTKVKPFAVVQDKTGLWRIPSTHNYPADGKDRLAKMAASMIGIKREGFAGPRENEHAEFGVLDPAKPEGVSDLKGVGNRITLKDADGKVLADYIIGKEVKGRSGLRYVRRPDEKPTYIAKLNIDVSTKFSDWIEADLLKIEGTRLNSIAIDTTTIDFAQGALIQGETNKLTRKASADPWKIEGLDEAKEEVNQDELRKLVSSLDELKIVGVRRKPAKMVQGLRSGKTLNQTLAAMDPQTQMVTKIELQSKGFILGVLQKGGAMLMIPKDGQVTALTDQGISYDLKFGEIFNGTEEEVEVGKDEEKKEGEEKDDAKKDEEKKESKEDNKSLQKSRYLYVAVTFDADGLGPKPAAPVKPEEPSDTPAAVDEDAPADALEPINTAPDPKQVYAAALAKYEQDEKRYEADSKAYGEKVKAGQKLVKDLNGRFVDWYYVVSGNSFENLRQGRKTLVKDKSAEATPPGNPGLPGLQGIPGLPPGIGLPPGTN